MPSNPIQYYPIGVIQSPFKEISGMPIQPSGAAGVRGKLILDPEFEEGLQDLEGFSHLILIYHFHRSSDPALVVEPFLDSEPHGIFATRAPQRPNAIGLSVVRLIKVNSNVLEIENVDMLDGTPLLDIKPYIPDFDQTKSVKAGWLEGKIDGAREKKSDTRFVDQGEE